jgi:hypothetical protein
LVLLHRSSSLGINGAAMVLLQAPEPQPATRPGEMKAANPALHLPGGGSCNHV